MVRPRHLTARNVAQFGILRAVFAAAGSLGARPPMCLQKGGSPELRPPLSQASVCLRQEALLFVLQSESWCFAAVLLGPGFGRF